MTFLTILVSKYTQVVCIIKLYSTYNNFINSCARHVLCSFCTFLSLCDVYFVYIPYQIVRFCVVNMDISDVYLTVYVVLYNVTFTCGCWFILVHKLVHKSHIHTYAIDGMGKKSFLKFVELYLMNL